MTNEEALKTLIAYGERNIIARTKVGIAFTMAIKALEQEPCEDAISRQAALKEFEEWINDGEDWNEHPVRFARSLVSLPPVTPKPKTEPKTDIRECKNCKHSKDGHMAGTEKCHECMWESKQEPKTGHWIMPVQDDGTSDPIYYQVRCSECGFDLDPQTWHVELHQYGADKYCPNCGVKMESEE